MKKLIGLAIAAMLLAAPMAMADEGPGCGLGKQVWVGQSGVVAHILALLTNNWTSPASSSITSGTSGCDANGVIYNDVEQQMFVSANFDYLSQEMAQGHGQNLQSLAALMGCGESQFPAFARLTQEKYGELMGMADTSTGAMLTSLKHEMAAHPTLSGCTRIS